MKNAEYWAWCEADRSGGIAMHRQTRPPSFVDTLRPDQPGRNERLRRIDETLDWGRIGEVVEELRSAPEGRPGYPR